MYILLTGDGIVSVGGVLPADGAGVGVERDCGYRFVTAIELDDGLLFAPCSSNARIAIVYVPGLMLAVSQA